MLHMVRRPKNCTESDKLIVAGLGAVLRSSHHMEHRELSPTESPRRSGQRLTIARLRSPAAPGHVQTRLLPNGLPVSRSRRRTRRCRLHARAFVALLAGPVGLDTKD